MREWLCRKRALDWDYFWATSRVIKDTINEYPFWSLTFADLHAHVLVLPWAVGVAFALVTVWLGRRAERHPHHRPRPASAALLALCALLLGAITVTNGSDLPTYIGLLSGAPRRRLARAGTRGGFVRASHRRHLGGPAVPRP